jgi:hypothetical protein
MKNVSNVLLGRMHLASMITRPILEAVETMVEVVEIMVGDMGDGSAVVLTTLYLPALELTRTAVLVEHLSLGGLGMDVDCNRNKVFAILF